MSRILKEVYHSDGSADDADLEDNDLDRLMTGRPYRKGKAHHEKIDEGRKTAFMRKEFNYFESS